MMMIKMISKIDWTMKFIIPKEMTGNISLKTRGKLLKVDTPNTDFTNSDIAKLLVNIAMIKASS